jgi:WD40 repeat protein
VAFSPDDTLIVSGGADGRVTLWDSRSGQSVAVLVGHAGPVVRLEFSADGSTLLSQDDRGIVLLWQVAGAETVDVG